MRTSQEFTTSIKPIGIARRPLLRLVWHPSATAFAVFVFIFIIYWISIPDRFNDKRSNRKFFDSDGEFIVRQFREDRTFTHNDHILYHVLGKALYDGADWIPGLRKSPVKAHKVMSSLFGACGVSMLFLIGVRISGLRLLSLFMALFAGGCSGYYFFSATIDTYVPGIFASIAALWTMLASFEKKTWLSYFVLGLAIGIAFLFRTDGFLTAIFLVVLFTLPNLKSLLTNTASILAGGVLAGIAGYFILAHFCYGVDWLDIPSWATGSTIRPETTQEGKWGAFSNLSLHNFSLVGINHIIYTVMIPGIERTRIANFPDAMQGVLWGWVTFFCYIAALVFAFGYSIAGAAKAFKTKQMKSPVIFSIAVLWIISRIAFYTWWDPYDPFLFAVMTMPAIWLIMISGFSNAFYSNTSCSRKSALLIFAAVVAALVWLHSIVYLVLPLKEFSQ